ncbi:MULTISPECIES: GNAT family N-acetyltransferase [Deinococcus]|uniref:GNAT family N-acetyltransferase n=1 Tax=Deinococcus rufus TaxID=2136097 RepID=A0ABV7ZBN7_9DEIO|nr:GNAT family N-acetyltransferase [Deinococcus sp. AB2017081]WQE95671.1 GNAT family N-acetyltransferase [Deinococcus sp. AB2017081]
MPDPTPIATDTSFTLRPFQNADSGAVAQLVTDAMRGHWTYAPEQFRESADPLCRDLVALHGEQVVATAHLSPFGTATPDALRLDLAGEGRAFTPLYLAVLADLPAGFTRLLGVTREDFHEIMHFFHAAGFRNAWQSWGAHLDLTAFDPAPFQSLEERLFVAGYETEQLSPDAPDADWDALHALYLAGIRDAPRNPTTTPEPLSRDDLRDTVRREEAAFVTRWRDEIVASTRLTPHGHEVESEHTVTHPQHRGRGLATALKGQALAWARAQGHTHAGTGGTVLNLPMLRVNTRLGYVTGPMWVTWERRV